MASISNAEAQAVKAPSPILRHKFLVVLIALGIVAVASLSCNVYFLATKDKDVRSLSLQNQVTTLKNQVQILNAEKQDALEKLGEVTGKIKTT